MQLGRSLAHVGRLLLLVSLLLSATPHSSAAALAGAPAPGAPVLARVEVAGSLESLGLPVYQHARDAAGREYALVIATQAELLGSGARYQVLDAPARAASDSGAYLLAVERRSGARAAAARLMAVLHDDGRTVLVYATPQQAETLSTLGFDVAWLSRTPVVTRTQPAPAPGLPLPPDPFVAEMIAQVQQSTVYTYNGGLSGMWPVTIGGLPYTILTRNSNTGTPVQKATQYVYEHAQALGLNPTYYNYSNCGLSNRNVTGDLIGSVHPEQIVLVTAHLDDMPSGSLAPGADDNGSGSVGVMVLADIMSQYTFDRTVRFVWFTGEEQGLCGSEAYAAYVHGLGENIVAVYNMDMIAYDAIGGPTLRIHTRPANTGDLAIASTFTDVVNTYGLSGSLTPIIDQDGITASDHASFWQQGYNGVLAIEDDQDDFNDAYHTTGDTMANNNIVYETNYVRASIGTAAVLAVPLGSPGALAGTVRNANNSAPIEGARVQATRLASVATLTGADGGYQLLLSAGTYTVTASAYGFHQATVTGVSITQGVTTTQNFSLAPAPTHVVSGTVRDVNTGLPLYAHLVIHGNPSDPPAQYGDLWTNPATGFYSTILAEDVSFTVDVSAGVPGYLPVQRALGTVIGNRTENFMLDVDELACNAPGYTRTGGVAEQFSSGSLPQDWTVIDNQGNGQVWVFNDPEPRGNLTGGGGLFAIIDSDHYGSGGQQNTELRSPLIDLRSYTTATIEFKTDYYKYSGESAQVDVSLNGSGGPWTTVKNYTSSARGPRSEVVDITALAAGHNNVMVRFHYFNASYEWWWQVDDVNVGPARCEPVSMTHKVYAPLAQFNAVP